MKTTYMLLIPGPARTHVLLTSNGQQVLPELGFAQPYFWQVVGHLNTAVREHIGLDVTTLRCFRIIDDLEHDTICLIYEMECHGAYQDLPAAYVWTGLDALGHVPPAQHATMMEWLDDPSRPSHSQPVPWYQPGWRDQISPWIQRTLEQANRRSTGPVEQVRSWERSALWRIPTHDGMVFFKAVPAMFGHEPALTARLAELFPDWIAPVLAVHPTHPWLMMANAGSRPLLEIKDIERWAKALRDYARLQIALVRESDALLNLNVPDRRLGWLRSGMDQMLGDTPALTSGPAGLTHEDVGALRALLPELRAACDVLEQSNLPATLEHGDFSTWQIQSEGDHHRFLDRS